MSKYYCWCVIYPAALIFLLTVLWAVVIRPVGQGADFAGFRVGITLILLVQLAVLLAILFAPVFLNSREEVRANTVKRYLSWWLLPGAYLLFLIIREFPLKPDAVSYERGTLFICLAIAAHIAGSLYGWFLFNKELEKERKELEQYNQ